MDWLIWGEEELQGFRSEERRDFFLFFNSNKRAEFGLEIYYNPTQTNGLIFGYGSGRENMWEMKQDCKIWVTTF